MKATAKNTPYEGEVKSCFFLIGFFPRFFLTINLSSKINFISHKRETTLELTHLKPTSIVRHHHK